ncbi:hypothetical protein OPQ81_000953 [Rhizoctonia solani]|nr:hypothetical protein OPQ81_000953 [Rhizoctonia solani]
MLKAIEPVATRHSSGSHPSWLTTCDERKIDTRGLWAIQQGWCTCVLRAPWSSMLPGLFLYIRISLHVARIS